MSKTDNIIRCRTINAAIKYLDAVNSRTRNLTAEDLRAAEAMYQRFKRAYPGTAIELETHGGAVPGSYRYRASSTWAVRSQDGWQILREKAEMRSHGDCWKYRINVFNSTVKQMKGFTARRGISATTPFVTYYSVERAG